jgi:ribosome-associated protein
MFDKRKTETNKSGRGKPAASGAKSKAGGGGRFKLNDRAKSGERSKPGDRPKPAERSKFGERAKPGDRPQSFDRAKPGERSKPGHWSKPSDRAKPAERAKPGERPLSASAARGRAAAAPSVVRTGKALPPRERVYGLKPPASGAARGPRKPASKRPAKRDVRTGNTGNPARLPVLRKPAARPPVDIGIGAVEVAPAAGTPRSIGLVAAEAAIDKKAFDVVLLDVRGISGLCDEMLVVSARSVTHLSAVCDGVEEVLRKLGERVLHSDGRHAAEPDWILLDYGDLMVHVFRPEARELTQLEAYYASARLVAKWQNEQ